MGKGKSWIVYIAGPYRNRHGVYFVQQNIEAARKVAAFLASRGIYYICPHMNSALMEGTAPDEFWLDLGLRLLDLCDCVLVLPDWEHSQGTKEEIAHAKRTGKPVYYWPGDEDELVRRATGRDV